MKRKLNHRQRTQRLVEQRHGKRSRPARNKIIGRSTDLGVEHLEPRWVLASPGSLDTTFDFDGVLTGDFGAAAGTDVRIQAVAVQADGKIVVAGTIDTTASPIEDIVVGRFNADGSLDTTFGDNDLIGGYTTFRFNGQQSFVNDVGIDASGNIVVVGRGVNAALTQNGFGVARLGSDGELDATFGTAGRVVTTFAAGSPAEAWAVAFQSDGKIVVAGLEDNPNATVNRNDFAIARYNTNGTLDTTFDGDGKVTTDFFGRDDNAFDVVMQQVGSIEKILVVGEADRAGLAINDFAMARYNPNGSLDTIGDGVDAVEFGVAGKVVTVTGTGALASQVSTIGAVTLDSLGRIIVAGTVGDSNTTTDMIIGRYSANGILDAATFNPAPVSGTFAGTLRIDFSLLDIGFGIVAQPDGKYVIGGSVITTTTSTTASYRYGLARVGTTGSLDSSFGTGGLVQVPAFADAAAPDPPFEPSEPDNLRMMDLVLQPDGKLLAAGWVDLETTEPDYLLARYETGLLTAEAGGPYAINEPGGSVVLSGSAVGSAPLVFEWDLDGDSIFGETGTGALRGNETGANPTFTVSGVDGPSSYTVTLRATDSTSVQAFDTATINVLNVAPTLTISGAASVNEGSSYTLNLSSFDPGPDTITSWTINWGDGSQIVPGNPTSVSHTYADGNAGYTISASATDEDGTHAASNTVSVSVANVAPTLTLTGAATVNESSSYTLNLSSFDPGADTITSWTINWGDGIQVVSGNPTSVNHTYADGNTNYTISASATDEDGTFSAGNTVAVAVLNVAPPLTISGAADVNEGASYTLNLSSFDPGPDTITSWTINWGDGSQVVSGNPASVPHTYADGDASYTIIASATDEDGTFAAGNTVAVAVHNVAPTLAISGAADVNEGSSYTLNLSAFDPGTDTITSWTINWGDGIQVVSGNPTSVAHTYTDGDANYAISASATDEDGTFAAGNTVAVAVHNVAPTLAISGASTANEGSSYTLNLSSSDPGTDTITSWTINWGDSTQVVSGNPTSVSHTYADGDAGYTISASATDEDGTFAAGNMVTVAVANVAPTLAISGAATVNEGSSYTLNLSSSDPGADTITSWTINWGDGTQIVSGNPTSVSHTYADGNLNYTISAAATDDDGTFAASNTVAVAVQNVAPTLTIAGAASVNEGSSYTLNLTSFDPGTDTITSWTINWGDGIQVVSGNPTSVSHTYADGNTGYTISAVAADEDGTYAAGNTVAVAVLNVAPALAISGASDVDEGASYTLSLSSFDPGADTISSWTINWGDGVQVVSGNPTSVSHTYADGDAGYTISASATDEDGTFAASSTIGVSVHNIAPTLTIAGASSVNEGSSYTLNLSSYDPGTDAISSWTINWGDGIEVVSGNPTSVSHTYADGNASRTISASATDEDGTFAAGNTVNVAVANVSPTLVISGAASVNEGSSYTLNLSSSDPGTDTITSWTINWGDGTQVVSGNPTSVSHTYADGNASRTISASATDEDGTFAAGNAVTVAVQNVAPTLAISGAASINEGSTYTLNLSSSDPGADTITSWTINWGDGTQVVSGNPTSVTHVYADNANFTISATATDEDGTFAAGNTVVVTVVNVGPTADAGGPYQTFDDTPITLSGSGSDVAGAADPLTFTWDLDGDNIFGETGVGATRGNEVGANVTYNPTGLGVSTQIVKLRANDGDGGITTATTTVQIIGQGTVLAGGVLYIVGSNTANDIVAITKIGSCIVVLATFNSNNPMTFSESAITEIQVRTRGGHDIVVTTPNVDKVMTIDGGSGNDLLTGGGGRNVIMGGTGNDVLYGDGGNDVLLGGDGNDDLFGGSGNDVLVGGNGCDVLDGGSGRDVLIGSQDEDELCGGGDEDVLIGGWTVHDSNVAALDAIMAIWSSSAAFSARVATLSGSGGMLQGGVTVFDDDDNDHLVGGSGRDLIFGDTYKWDGAIDQISLQAAQDVLVSVN